MADARLGELLLQANVLTRAQLEEAERIKQRTGVRLGQILVDHGWVQERALYDALARAASLPRLDMKTVVVRREAIAHVDSIWALDHGMVPVDVDNRMRLITVAVTDPTNIEPLDELFFSSGFKVRALLGSEAEIGRLIRHQFFEERLEREDEEEEEVRPPSPDDGAVEHGMSSALHEIARRSVPTAPPSPRSSPPLPPAPPRPDPNEVALLEVLRPVFEGHQDNAKQLQAIFELCVRYGIITREEYLQRLAAAPD